MASDCRAVVITADPAEAEAVAATLRGSSEPAVDVLVAPTPTDAFRHHEFRDASLVLYDAVPLRGSAGPIRDLFPRAAVMALADPGSEAILEAELGAGAGDYLLRDGAGAYLRLLRLKASRLFADRSRSMSPVSRLEESLRQSEIRFGQLVQAIPDIVYHLDPAGNFVFLNSSVSTLGYSPADLIGRHFSFIIHPEDLPYVSRAHVMKRYHTGEARPGDAPKLFDERRSGERRTRNLIVRLMTKPGGGTEESHRIGDVVSYGVIEAMGHYEDGDGLEHPRRDPDSFRGTVGIIHDITVHRRSEQMIRVLLQAVDQCPLPVVVTDSAGGVDYVNPRFLRSSKLLPEEVIGRNVVHLTESSRLRDLFRELAAAVKAGGEWHGQLPALGGSTGAARRDVYVSPVRDPLGRLTHFIAVIAGDGASVEL